ncbi:MAG: dipeptide/oligopeptide/nickel ABC transporter permease/ATP-binding protein [Acidimicrobiales bacterium]
MSKSSSQSSHSSPWARAARRFARDPLGMVALLFIVFVCALAVFAPWVCKHEPNFQDLDSLFEGPSSDHWLGTDNLGRDTFARLVYGARVSMQASFTVALLGVLIAVPIGLMAGYKSGTPDNIVMRLTDALLSIPPLVLALAIAGILGPGTTNAIIALTIVVVPGLVRLVRGQALSVREEGFVEASRAIGTHSRVIVRRRVLPHVLSPLLVQISVLLGMILVVEASLSFLGLGAQLPNASWGGMLKDGFAVMATDARLVIVPGLAIAFATLAFNAIGDSLREALLGDNTPSRKRGDVLGTTTVAAPASLAGTTTVAAPASPAGTTTVAAPASPAAATSTAPLIHATPERDGSGPAPVLQIRDLSVGFDTGGGVIPVLDRVNLAVRKGEILGLVGESGCGKTVTSLSVLRLLPSPPARILGGEILFEGRDLLRLSSKDLREVRGAEIAMVFQDPMASLNPAYTIGKQIVEAQRLHKSVSRSAARKRAAELLELVGIPDPTRRLDDFPHTFSGGMRQRALIAMALANDPKLLIADEPTTALDVTVQAQILELIHSLRDELGMSVMFVTHDLGVVEDLCDRVAVMYAGQVVEASSVADLLAAPLHPYTAGLLRSRPEVGAGLDRLPSIPGVVPSPSAMPEGCRFYDRCSYAVDACTSPVSLTVLPKERQVRCVRHAELDLTVPSEERDLHVPDVVAQP